MKETFLQELENKSLEDLISLKEQHPYSAIYHMVAAKKAKFTHDERENDFIASAALRVPSRKILKSYVENEATEWQPKNLLESILSAPFRKKSSPDEDIDAQENKIESSELEMDENSRTIKRKTFIEPENPLNQNQEGKSEIIENQTEALDPDFDEDSKDFLKELSEFSDAQEEQKNDFNEDVQEHQESTENTFNIKEQEHVINEINSEPVEPSQEDFEVELNHIEIGDEQQELVSETPREDSESFSDSIHMDSTEVETGEDKEQEELVTNNEVEDQIDENQNHLDTQEEGEISDNTTHTNTENFVNDLESVNSLDHSEIEGNIFHNDEQKQIVQERPENSSLNEDTLTKQSSDKNSEQIKSEKELDNIDDSELNSDVKDFDSEEKSKLEGELDELSIDEIETDADNKQVESSDNLQDLTIDSTNVGVTEKDYNKITEEELELEPTLPSNEDTILDDDLDEIGEELVLEEDTNLDLNENKAVDQLSTKDSDSVYKQVVEILKNDQTNNPNHSSFSTIVDEPPIKHPQDEDVDSYLVEKELDETQDQFDKISTDQDDIYDAELEKLYKEASYEFEIENEIKDMKETDNAPIENFDESEGKLSFMGWLDHFSKKQNNNHSQSSSTDNGQSKEDTIARSIEYQYRDSEEDLNDETSRKVQEVAMKSMKKDESFYTETLANIYEMQEKYEQAIEVYEQLALKNSEKSSYFTDQINKIKEKLN